MSRLAPLRRQWDLAVLANLAAGTERPGDLIEAATTGGPLWATTYIKGTVILLDPAGAVYAGIGAGNLRAYVAGQDDLGRAALAN